MHQWYIQTNPDEEVGPLRPGDLLQAVRSGKVTPETKVRKGDSAWFYAAEVGGLFEAAVKPTIEYLCPRCQHKVVAGPSRCSLCGHDVEHPLEREIPNKIVSHTSRTTSDRSMLKWLKRKNLR